MLCDKKYKGFTLKCDKVSTELHTSSFFKPTDFFSCTTCNEYRT